MQEKYSILFTLNHRVSVYVPSTHNVGEHVDNSAQVKLVMEKMSTYFGGATSTSAVGGWMSDSRGLVTEKVTIVYAYADQEALNSHVEDVLQLAHDICTLMSQECVAVEIDGKMQFIR